MNKLSVLDTNPALSTDDLLYVVDDAGGTPASYKSTIAAVLGLITDISCGIITTTGRINQTGSNNSNYIGDNAGALSTGFSNIGIGYQSIYAAATGTGNVGVGYQSIRSLLGGNYNIGIGYQSVLGVTTGNGNVGIGNGVMTAVGSANYNIGIGYFVLPNTTGASNIAIGGQALSGCVGGSYNIAIGTQSLFSLVSNGFNLSLGYKAGYAATGIGNVFLGREAATDATSGNFNIIIGYITGLGITSGAYNTIIGSQISGLTAGLSNTCILADGQGNKRIIIDSSGNSNLYGNLTLQNSTTAVIEEISKTYTSATDREYLSLGYNSGLTHYFVGSRVGSAGGTNRALKLGHLAADGTTFTGATVAIDGTVTFSATVTASGLITASATSGFSATFNRGVSDSSISANYYYFTAGNAHQFGKSAIHESAIYFADGAGANTQQIWGIKNTSDKLIISGTASGVSNYANTLVVSAGQIGIGKTPTVALDVSGTISASKVNIIMSSGSTSRAINGTAYGSGLSQSGGVFVANYTRGTESSPTAPSIGDICNSLSFCSAGTTGTVSTIPFFQIKHTLVSPQGSSGTAVDTDFMVNNTGTGIAFSAMTLRGQTGNTEFSGTVTTAGNLTLQNSTTAVIEEISKTYTSATDREYLSLGYNSGLTGYFLGSRVGSAGGTNRDLKLGHLAADGTTFAGMSVATNGVVTVTNLDCGTIRNTSSGLRGRLDLSNGTGTTYATIMLTLYGGNAQAAMYTRGDKSVSALFDFDVAGKTTLAASTTSKATLNIPSGTAPTTPVDGDIWSDGTDLKIRLGGNTYTITKS